MSIYSHSRCAREGVALTRTPTPPMNQALQTQLPSAHGFTAPYCAVGIMLLMILLPQELNVVLSEASSSPPTAAKLNKAKSESLNSWVFNFASRAKQLRRAMVYELLGVPQVRVVAEEWGGKGGGAGRVQAGGTGREKGVEPVSKGLAKALQYHLNECHLWGINGVSTRMDERCVGCCPDH